MRLDQTFKNENSYPDFPHINCTSHTEYMTVKYFKYEYIVEAVLKGSSKNCKSCLFKC